MPKIWRKTLHGTDCVMHAEYRSPVRLTVRYERRTMYGVVGGDMRLR